MNHNPKVFISYSHDSPEHADQVLKFSNRLISDGIDCVLDQYVVSPPEGWPRWMDKWIRDADFVLMVCTETYYRRVMGEEIPGRGLGVRWEGNLIYNHIYHAGTRISKFVPVLLENGNVEHIAVPLKGVTYYRADTEEGYENLYRYITDQPISLKPELGKLRELPPRERKTNFFIPWNVRYPRNPFFTGREEILEHLRIVLMSDRSAALAQPQSISGLGGIGKTQTAVEYVYRNRNEYTAILWVAADSRETMVSEFVSIANVLDLPEKSAEDQNVAVAAVKRWLEANSGWLLILDNANDARLIEDFIPLDLKGNLLLTSRAQVFHNLGIVQPIELQKMTPDEAEEFLVKRTGRSDLIEEEVEAIKQLPQDLDYLPLALEQAGAYIAEIKCSFQDYLSSYHNRGLNLLEMTKPMTSNYPNSVLTTWSINFEQVENASKPAADLLRVSAFLHPDNIPRELIAFGAMELGPELLNALVNVDSDPVVLDEVLRPLTRYSLIRKNVALRTYDIHRLVQAVLRETMDEPMQRQWIERAIRAVNKAFPDSEEFSEWDTCERLLRHAQTCAQFIKKCGPAFKETAQLLSKTGFYLYQRSRYADAEPILRKALEISEKLLGAEHPDVATNANILAMLFDTQGKYIEAETLYQRALAIREKHFGVDHPDVARSLNNLAVLCWEQGKYSEAESLYERALEISQKTLGAEHPDVALRLNNLGVLYRDQGKYTDAESFLKRAIKIREKVLEAEHPDMAQSLHNLAKLYQLQGKYAEAEPVHKQALAIWEKVLGADHPHVATSLNNLGSLCCAQGKYAEAERLYERALLIREKAFGSEHPDIASTLENYAILFRETSRYAEALTFEARAKAIQAKHNPQKRRKVNTHVSTSL